MKKYLLGFLFISLALFSCSDEEDKKQSNNTEDPTPTKDTYTIWKGAEITFTKTAGTNPSEAANQDRLTDNVWITRGNEGGQIYNAVSEDQANKETSPAGTKWAVGDISNISNLTFKNFRAAVGEPKNVEEKKLVLFLEKDSIYLPVEFISWSKKEDGAGGFAYKRATKN